MEDEEGYTVLNLRPQEKTTTRPSPGRIQDSPLSSQRFKRMLGILGAVCIILTVAVIILTILVFQGASNQTLKRNPAESDGVTQQTGSGGEHNASLEDLFSRLKQSLCDPAQISSAGGSRCKLCPRDWVLHGDKCYWLSNEADSWSKSHDDCSRKGSQMLVIQDREQMNSLQPVLPADHAVWIGLTFNSTQRKWTWLDGAPVHEELVPGLRQAENNSCGALKRNTVNFDVCSSEFKWLCQKAAFLL
ncbi:killer cell lectin-like receptor subfamily F member 1 [Malaclemys terrapin pileata]|uniref:killer cell lectin-like receptor subfamily F member 1 n=1 Tax=Malaclemys terrapin pileata TaxID=2991368 RepID=UPI0023A7CEA2|nr:killer cell lectin-like receptor subfamily F member 1 [Malaclemys terrapin pileata]